MHGAVNADESTSFSSEQGDSFARRHIGPGNAEISAMLEACGFDTLEALTDAAVPESIQSKSGLDLPPARTEAEALGDLGGILLCYLAARVDEQERSEKKGRRLPRSLATSELLLGPRCLGPWPKVSNRVPNTQPLDRLSEKSETISQPGSV